MNPPHFTSVEILAIGGVLVSVIGAFGAIVVNIIVSLRKQVATVEAVTKEIAASVNGAATAAAAREEALRTEIRIIREVLAEKKTTDILAHASPAAPVKVEVINTPEQSVPVTPTKPEAKS